MLLYCVVIEYLSHHSAWKEKNVFPLKWHHITVVSKHGTVGPTAVLPASLC